MDEGENMGKELRVRIAAAKAEHDVHGTATEADEGYTVKWDDGFEDYSATRWHFEGDGIFNLEEVK